MTNFENVLQFIKRNAEQPFVKYILERSGFTVNDVKVYEDFKKVKPLTRIQLKELSSNIKRFIPLLGCCPIKIFESPGPIYNIKVEDFYQYRFYKALEYSSFGPSDLVVNTFSYHLTPAGEIFDEAARKIGATVIPVGPSSSSKCAEVIKNTKATGFIGTKTFLKKVLEELNSSNTLLKAYLIAEKITTQERKELTEKYNIEIYQGYGTAEIGLIATECEYKEGMHIDDEVFVEFLDPVTFEVTPEGETGEVFVTLLNSKYPLIRYATGDLAVFTAETCKCKKEIPRIVNIAGRVDSSVKVKGVFIHKWIFDDFCDKNNIYAELLVCNDNKNNDYLKILLNKSIPDIEEKFKETFKLRLNSVEIDQNICENKITEDRSYFKKR